MIKLDGKIIRMEKFRDEDEEKEYRIIGATIIGDELQFILLSKNGDEIIKLPSIYIKKMWRITELEGKKYYQE